LAGAFQAGDLLSDEDFPYFLIALPRNFIAHDFGARSSAGYAFGGMAMAAPPGQKELTSHRLVMADGRIKYLTL